MGKKLLVLLVIVTVLSTSALVVVSVSRTWLKLSKVQNQQLTQIANTPEILEVGSTQVNFVFEKIGNPQPAGGEYTVNLKIGSITGTSTIDVTGLQLRIKYSDGLTIKSLPANMGKLNVSFDSVKNNATKKTIDAFFIADGDDSTPFPKLTTGETLLSFKVSSASVASYKVGFDNTFANSVFLSDATTDAMGTLPGDLDISFVDVQNTPPVISGTPSVTVNENEDYTFTPTASDADADSLTFSITNKPSWASFDTTTGKLSGKPGSANIGKFSNITISVSDGKDIVNLNPFDIEVFRTTPLVATVEVIQPIQNQVFPLGSPIEFKFNLTNNFFENSYWVPSVSIYTFEDQKFYNPTCEWLNDTKSACGFIWTTPTVGKYYILGRMPQAGPDTVVEKVSFSVGENNIYIGYSYGNNHTVELALGENDKLTVYTDLEDVDVFYTLGGEIPTVNSQKLIFTKGVKNFESEIKLDTPGQVIVKVLAKKSGYEDTYSETKFTLSFRGDVNDDAKVDETDARLILDYYLSGEKDPDLSRKYNVDFDYEINLNDVVEVAKYAEIAKQ